MALRVDQLRTHFDEMRGELRGYIERRMPRHLSGALTADDLLQEVWLTASDNIASIRDPAAVGKWLRRITEHKLIDALRFVRSGKRGGGRYHHNMSTPSSSRLALFRRLAAEQRTPSSVDAAREAADAVKNALVVLPENYRRAMTLYYIDGLSRDEIAETMTRSPAAVNSMIYRGLLMLRNRLGSADKFFTTR